jgi:hypothetical protein
MRKRTPHTRAIPPEWPGLLEYAKKVIPPEQQEYPPAYRPVRRLVGKVRKLEHQRLEANYYFALGEVMTGMSAELRDPAIRGRVIREAANGLLLTALRRRGLTIPMDKSFVPYVDDLLPEAADENSPASMPKALTKPFAALARLALHKMPAPNQTLAHTMTAATLYGRSRNAPGFLKKVPHYMLLTDVIRTQEPIVEQLAENSLSGTTSVLIRLLTGCSPKEDLPNGATNMPIDFEALEQHRTSSVFITAAGVRHDEFIAGAGWTDSGAAPHFDRDILATPPEPVEPALIAPGAINFHQDRLICPAIQANDLARNMARYILPSIIQTASNLIPGEEYILIAPHIQGG